MATHHVKINGEARGAEISSCFQYRYWLARRWGKPRAKGERYWNDVCFIGLNPSTADALKDDATVRRWRGFSQSWGFDGFWAVNLYGFRSTDPRGLSEISDPVGPENDRWILNVARKCKLVVACWGNNADEKRVRHVVRMLKKQGIKIYCITETKRGQPAHPLRLSGKLQPQPWSSIH